MYLTAHRVTNPTDGATGVNAFKHLHSRPLNVDSSWDYEKVKEISCHDPGKLVATAAELDPGGNRVLSYLEVICDDGTDSDSIRSELDEFDLLRKPVALTNHNRIVVYFSTIQGLAGQEKLEYTALQAAILRLLKE